jgi:hypothetical protein
MGDAAEASEYVDPPWVAVHHFLTARAIWYDSERIESGIGISGIFIHLVPRGGLSFPYIFDWVFVYFQMSGDAGDYFVRVRLVKIETDENNEEYEVQIGRDGGSMEFFPDTTRPFGISGLNYCEEYSFLLPAFQIDETGIYEYQLFVEGFEEPLGRERVEAREY